MLHRQPRRIPLAAGLALVVFVVTGAVSPAPAAERWRPNPQQLKRLQDLEPYISYFTSLTYGGEKANISRAYIRALILIESGGDTTARSPFGARGVTQILPATARSVLSQLAGLRRDFRFIDEKVFTRFQAEDLHDPALNILIACYLNATYHAMYDGRTDLVIAAWNAGPGAVARYHNRPPPFAETRDLIARLEHMIEYLDRTELN